MGANKEDLRKFEAMERNDLSPDMFTCNILTMGTALYCREIKR
jgi:hypothetical protein